MTVEQPVSNSEPIQVQQSIDVKMDEAPPSPAKVEGPPPSLASIIVPSTDDASFTAEANEEAKGIQHWGVLFAVFLCFIGQFFIWVKEESITPTVNPGSWQPMTLGTYAFMMLLSALVNYMSLRMAQPWLYVASVAVGLSIVLDVNVCVNDWLTDAVDTNSRGKSWNWELRLGYLLSLIGYIGSFLAMPVDPANIKLDWATIIDTVLGVMLIGGNIAMWKNEGAVKGGSYICPISHKVREGLADTGLPVHVTRAFTTGLLHIAASLFHWEGGQWMTFLIACISVADYMPAGSGPGRCKHGDEKGCEAGVWISFLGMWMLIMAHIVLKRGKKMPDLSKVNPFNGPRSLFGLMGPLMCITGMLMVAIENHKKNDANKAIRGNDVGSYEDLGAQETYDVFQTAVGSLLIFWGYLATNNRIGVAGLCMHFSVFNRLLGASGKLDFIGTCPYKWSAVPEGIHNSTDSVVRSGYILLIVGALSTAVSLVDLDILTNASSQGVQITGLIVLSCIMFLWSADKWYGQMGYTALLAAVFHTFQYKQGLDAVYFWSCMQLASQTPFTTCEGNGNFLAFVVTVATLGLFYFTYAHLQVRGAAKGEPEEDEVEVSTGTDANQKEAV